MTFVPLITTRTICGNVLTLDTNLKVTFLHALFWLTPNSTWLEIYYLVRVPFKIVWVFAPLGELF